MGGTAAQPTLLDGGREPLPSGPRDSRRVGAVARPPPDSRAQRLPGPAPRRPSLAVRPSPPAGSAPTRHALDSAIPSRWSKRRLRRVCCQHAPVVELRLRQSKRRLRRVCWRRENCPDRRICCNSSFATIMRAVKQLGATGPRAFSIVTLLSSRPGPPARPGRPATGPRRRSRASALHHDSESRATSSRVRPLANRPGPICPDSFPAAGRERAPPLY